MLPYLFTIFGFHFPTYGLLVAIAFLLALAVTAKLARRNNLDSETVLNLGIYCAMAGIAGAKLVTFDKCGHVPPIEKTEEFLVAITSFLGGAAAAAH